MPLVDSLLTAVVRSDGDALVLHVGEKPYVVAASGPVELSRQGLGLGARGYARRSTNDVSMPSRRSSASRPDLSSALR